MDLTTLVRKSWLFIFLISPVDLSFPRNWIMLFLVHWNHKADGLIFFLDCEFLNYSWIFAKNSRIILFSYNSFEGKVCELNCFYLWFTTSTYCHILWERWEFAWRYLSVFTGFRYTLWPYCPSFWPPKCPMKWSASEWIRCSH